MRPLSLPVILVATSLLSGLAGAPALAQTATPPYELSVFASAPKGLSKPDSIAVAGDHVFVGYGDGNAPDGSDGKSTQIVDYSMDGAVQYTYTVKGHSDGLKVDPATHLLWALQNEDASANLVIINPKTHRKSLYTFGPTLHGGGYDDLVFRGCKVFISASNPASNPNSGPAIVSAQVWNQPAATAVTPVESPETVTGTGLSVIESFPSWPSSPAPQHQAPASVVMPQE